LADSIFVVCRNPHFLNAYKGESAKGSRGGGSVWVGSGGFRRVFENAIGKKKAAPKTALMSSSGFSRNARQPFFLFFYFLTTRNDFQPKPPDFVILENPV
jgi:hypothetical protein